MGNNASNNENGIWVDFSSNNTVTGNNANSNNKRGIVLTSSSDNNIITGNNASDNYWGIYLSYSRNNIITGNNASNNYDGICLYHLSNKNNCYHNNFMNNTQNAYDEGNNTWDNGYPSGGNYWSDYTGTDDDGDGIGDTPYNISGGNNQDYYPLMFPYGMTRLTITIQLSTFKVTMLIKNVGNFTAFNVGWDITVKGGFIFFGRNSSGELPQPLQPGQEIMVKSRFLLGLGKIEMTYAAWADNAPIVSTRINGILLLFFCICLAQAQFISD
jgi:parallel beta-helix repeat protein